ncbi:DUF1810 domain-containing protein [Antarctobacter jejuensis]|uniref:DUF1810 domain-containing protein n=1 Tax=Antarctobacter jejuensis TaxID=1439938 RepID=UPI003FD41940
MTATHAEFLTAQEPVWADVQRELRQGRKVTHWIWWFFPQLAVLGRSPRARHFGLAGLDEAQAYYAHPVLGQRLRDSAELLLAHANTDPVDILGPVDALKVRSCMTLFEAVPDAAPCFSQVLDRMYDGQRCPVTTAVLTTST